MDCDEQKLIGQLEAVKMEYDRIEGELDAALVFAAAAKHSYETGNSNFGQTCWSDAKSCFTVAIDNLSKATLAREHWRLLVLKINHVRQRLNYLSPNVQIGLEGSTQHRRVRVSGSGA